MKVVSVLRFWLTYNQGGHPLGVVVVDSSSLIQARIRVASDIDLNGDFVEGHQLDEAVAPRIPAAAIGRMLSPKEATRLLDYLESGISTRASGVIGDAERNDRPYVKGIRVEVSRNALRTSDNGDPSGSVTTRASDEKSTRASSADGAGWFRPLDYPVTLPGGLTLKTLAEAGAFILDLPEHTKQRNSWQCATDLLLKAANGTGSVEAATAQIERALFLERYLAAAE
jgi:hypothetical protein